MDDQNPAFFPTGASQPDSGEKRAGIAATVEIQKDSGYDFAPWKPPFYYDDQGSMICDSEDHMIIDIRGWGFLTGRGYAARGLRDEVAEGIQNRLGDFLTKLLNEHSVVKP